MPSTASYRAFAAAPFRFAHSAAQPVYAGLITGATGIAGLTMGGWLAFHLPAPTLGTRTIALLCLRVGRRFAGDCCRPGAGQLLGGAIHGAVFAAGVLAYYSYYACVYPALHDVVAPRLRGTAFAVYFAAMYLLGGAFGPAVVGALSDRLAKTAMHAAGVDLMNEGFKAAGL